MLPGFCNLDSLLWLEQCSNALNFNVEMSASYWVVQEPGLHLLAFRRVVICIHLQPVGFAVSSFHLPNMIKTFSNKTFFKKYIPSISNSRKKQKQRREQWRLKYLERKGHFILIQLFSKCLLIMKKYHNLLSHYFLCWPMSNKCSSIYMTKGDQMCLDIKVRLQRKKMPPMAHLEYKVLNLKCSI